jgi:hypothetical protein
MLMSTFEELDKLSRSRPLSQSETLRLERALRRKGEKAGQQRWSQADLLRLRRHLLNGKKPAQISILISRSERSIWRMMSRLGWAIQDAQLWIINPQIAPWIMAPGEKVKWAADDNYGRPERKRTVQTNDKRRNGRRGE